MGHPDAMFIPGTIIIPTTIDGTIMHLPIGLLGRIGTRIGKVVPSRTCYGWPLLGRSAPRSK